MNNFKFDLNAKRVRLSDDDLLSSLEEYAEKVDLEYFSTIEYDRWDGKKACSGTIVKRFGSWNKALKVLGIEGGRERKYSPEELVNNLEDIWKQLGYLPGKRAINKYGQKISERPYKKIWGSVKLACEYIAKYHDGKITKDQLYNGNTETNTRKTVPLKIRWKILKRDNYTCKKCGQSPAKDNDVELEIDHIVPVTKSGVNNVENLQTLCKKCNQGKKDKL